MQLKLPQARLLLFACLLAACVSGFAQQPLPPVSIAWHDAGTLMLDGKGWPASETQALYDRLPAKAEKIVRPDVWRLSRNSAGLSIRFVTDAESLQFRWNLRTSLLALPNMASIAVSGLDLYVRDAGRWRWAASARADKQSGNEQRLITNIAPRRKREFLLYLPLYNGVESLQIGVPAGASISPAKRSALRPVVFYGTSIVQGASASRPGMSYTSILARRLDYPVVNLGFSGNGRMESEVAELLAEIDAAVYVIDCLPNLSTGADVTERTPKVVRLLRAKRPTIPIVLIENLLYPDIFIESSKNRIVREKNEALRNAYRELTASGVKHLHYVPATELIGRDGEGTIDGVHPTDLGFVRIADVLSSRLRRLRPPQERQKRLVF